MPTYQFRLLNDDGSLHLQRVDTCANDSDAMRISWQPSPCDVRAGASLEALLTSRAGHCGDASFPVLSSNQSSYGSGCPVKRSFFDLEDLSKQSLQMHPRTVSIDARVPSKSFGGTTKLGSFGSDDAQGNAASPDPPTTKSPKHPQLSNVVDAPRERYGGGFVIGGARRPKPPSGKKD
jgi:hypothetical protein